jgi:hypothetical protein
MRTSKVVAVMAVAVVIGLGGGHAQAQTTLEVGGASTIGDTTLTTSGGTAVVPAPIGWNWTTDGGGDADTGSIYALLNSPTQTVQNAGDVTLTFEHRYSFETDWDGGTVYISVNDGPWTHVPTNAFTANGYVKVLDASSRGGPFPGLDDVFTGKSTGYDTPVHLTSIADLGTFATNDTIAIQFRGGWDWGGTWAAPNWEIGTVKLTDSTAAVMLDVDFLDGAAGFTEASDVGLAGPWTFSSTPKGINKFEIDADALTADRYVPDVAGSVIDLNDALLEVVVLAGTLDVSDTFTLFDLTGGSTLTGSVESISLPVGTWDTSNLWVSGTITCLSVPIVSIIFQVDHTNLPAVGDPVATWNNFTKGGGAPTVVELGGEKWYSNRYTTADMMRHNSGNHTNAITIDGATIVTAVKPERNPTQDSQPWDSIVDCFYDQLCLGIDNISGQVKVKINGASGQNSTWGGGVIPEEPGVLTLSVGNGANPAFEVFWRGENDAAAVSMGTGHGTTGGQPYTVLYPQANGRSFAGYMNLGSNNPDGWSTYNGLIGDTYVYDAQLTGSALLAVQDQVRAAMDLRSAPPLGMLIMVR